MRKIKIIELQGHSYIEEHGLPLYHVWGFTEWEEVSEEDYQALQQWVYAHNQNYDSYDKKFMMVEEKRLDIPATVQEYVEKARVVKAKDDERKAKMNAKIQKREEARFKRLEKNKDKEEAKEEAKEKALLEKLRLKYEA